MNRTGRNFCSAMAAGDVESNPSTWTEEDHHTAKSSKDDPSNQEQKNVAGSISSKTVSLMVVLVLLFVGGVAAALFLFIGISEANDDQEQEFDRTSNDIMHALDMALNDYVIAASYIQEATSFNNVTREELEGMYLNSESSGLHVPMVSYNPYVHHMERAKMEEASRAYYQSEYPDLPYHGIQGLEPSPEHGSADTIQYRSEQPYYFPCHLIEPVDGNEQFVDFDLYSVPEIQTHIDQVLETWEPALTSRRGVDPLAYSILLLHPGISNEQQAHKRNLQHHAGSHMQDSQSSSMEESSQGTHTQEESRQSQGAKPASFTAIQIQVSDLLGGLIHSLPREEVYVYIYSASDEFLSGAAVSPGDDHNIEHHHAPVLTFQPEVSKQELLQNSYRGLKTREHTFVPLPSESHRTWTVYVIAAPGTYESETIIIVTAGVMLFALCAFLGAFIYGNIRRVDKLNQLEAQAQREKAVLIVEAASNAAKRERDLNDFIAHEVRNPLAAAMSACSFVTSEVLDEKQPMIRPERYQSVKEDCEIVESSLHFINDLLRNMLDMQRAGTKQLKIEKAPTHVMDDILRPVDCMLHRRGADFKVILECDDNLVVMTDPLRLKQIMLNLTRNSAKFVERGFIRLKATAVLDSTTNTSSVRLCVEDSGPGIPLEKREQLFGKFQDSLDSLHQGTGIGLSLCKQLTNLMGGKLWIDEDYDSGFSGCPGARFVVDLNVAPMEWDDELLEKYEAYQENDRSTSLSTAEEVLEEVSIDLSKAPNKAKCGAKSDSLASSSHSTCVTQFSSSTMGQNDGADLQLPEELSVLFVDDDMVLRKLFSRSVRKIGPKWKVQEAGNGEAALSITKTETFDVIFMDQYMASVQKQLLGTEATKALRAQGVTSKICGLSANDVEKFFLEAGADSFMMKPFPCKPGALRKELFRVINTGRKDDRELSSTSLSSVDVWVERTRG
jgi:signal transduction histidine kinase/CheY-like chemotaxis protein